MINLVETILSIIRDIAYIFAQTMKGKDARDKLKLLSELESLKTKIAKAIDNGDEVLLTELLQKKKDIEEKIRIINNQQDKDLKRKLKNYRSKKYRAVKSITAKIRQV
jgi:phage shock protein A